MVTIEATPDFAIQTYERMTERLGIVRKRLDRPMSLAEKVLLSHLDDPENQRIAPGETYIRVRPDRVILQDVLGQTAISSCRRCATRWQFQRRSTATT